MFCRLIIWRAKLDFDIIEIVFKMDSGKKKLKEMPSVSDSYSLTPSYFVALNSSYFFSKIKTFSRFKLYNLSCVSEHVAKRTCILY